MPSVLVVLVVHGGVFPVPEPGAGHVKQRVHLVTGRHDDVRVCVAFLVLGCGAGPGARGDYVCPQLVDVLWYKYFFCESVFEPETLCLLLSNFLFLLYIHDEGCFFSIFLFF